MYASQLLSEHIVIQPKITNLSKLASASHTCLWDVAFCNSISSFAVEYKGQAVCNRVISSGVTLIDKGPGGCAGSRSKRNEPFQT